MKKCRARILSAVFLQVGLASFARPQDPAVDALPYNEEHWNGTWAGNDNLRKVYNIYPVAVERLINQIFSTSDIPVKDAYPRPYQAPLEKTYDLAKAIPEWQKGYKSREEMVRSFSAGLRLDENRLAYLLSELDKVRRGIRLQDKANCFVYSMNDPETAPMDDMKPGFLATGKRYSEIDVSAPEYLNKKIRELIDLTVVSGAEFAGNDPVAPTGYYTVAAFIKPPLKNAQNVVEGIGMHYMRRDKDGGWSHKFANYNVTKLDFAGNVITDPARADLRSGIGNYIFIGYFNVPRGGLNVLAPVPAPSHKIQVPIP